MICSKCREWCAKGAANCQRCKRPAQNVTEWDKKMEKVKIVGGFLLILALTFLLVFIGKVANRGMDKLLDGWF